MKKETEFRSVIKQDFFSLGIRFITSETKSGIMANSVQIMLSDIKAYTAPMYSSALSL
ncbi:hypothetical protein [Elizabethkingia miricola]|uniref:Uncharacterized protein n=1 Tax=Elizabethkingia miricola TaxID=172045 RepID=A0ABD5BAS4_ELIMR|nr:hypothetical protein [Elizabethkingia miricola]MDQ8751037.1 hypothetical protein [Elizabethkingia miricola]